jgi:hypothetical protein
MTEKISFEDLLMDVCGLNKNELDWLNAVGITDLEVLRTMSEKRLDAVVARQKDAADDDESTDSSFEPFRILSETNLKLLWSEVRIRYETGRDIEEIRNVGVSSSHLSIWEDRYRQRKGFQDPPFQQRPSAKRIERNWILGFRILDEWIGSHVDDVYKIPLSIMTRDEPQPVYIDQSYATLESEYAQNCPRSRQVMGSDTVETTWYQPASHKLWNILYSIFVNHSAYGHMWAYRTTKNGHEAYKALKNFYAGKSCVGWVATDVEAQFSNLFYRGEGRHWNFEKYVTKHVDLYYQAEYLMKFGYSGIDPASRVRKFMHGIQTNKLDSVRVTIITNSALRKDFDKVVGLYRNFIAQDKSMNAGRLTSPIADVNGHGNSSRNGGGGGEGRRRTKRSNGQISQVAVDRYYTPAENAKLSKDEKAALYKLRQGSKRQRGDVMAVQ